MVVNEKLERKEMKNSVEVGIITFHCSDNFGAMLQAYGLKKYLCNNGIDANIVPYEPLFMIGRHWWIPYIPTGDFLECIRNVKWGWKMHLCMKKDFFKARCNMGYFRKKYLTEKGHRKIHFDFQLNRLSYPYYIVGSDQIWNPDITCGLRKVYFGAFKNKQKKKVIAYGASLGRDFLDAQYDKKFSELITHVDAISVREESAIPYIKRFCKGNVRSVLDPVFLLEKGEWMRIENLPIIEGYILVYVTEYNKELVNYVKKLSKDKRLSIMELKTDMGGVDSGFQIDDTAGPAEFLGYVHKADYVVTNSFHAVAFSLIYQKKFLAFPHTSRNARLDNMLKIHGLERRLWQEGKEMQIDSPIDWGEVKRKTTENVRASIDYLMEHLS